MRITYIWVYQSVTCFPSIQVHHRGKVLEDFRPPFFLCGSRAGSECFFEAPIFRLWSSPRIKIEEDFKRKFKSAYTKALFPKSQKTFSYIGSLKYFHLTRF